MKNIFKILVISFTLGLVFGIASISMAQPPDPPSNHGNGSNQAPGGGMAPIGSGIVLMISMGAAYGAKKIFNARNKFQEKN